MVGDSDGCAGQEVRPAVQGSGRSEFTVASRRGSLPGYSGSPSFDPGRLGFAGMMPSGMDVKTAISLLVECLVGFPQRSCGMRVWMAKDILFASIASAWIICQANTNV